MEDKDDESLDEYGKPPRKCTCTNWCIGSSRLEEGEHCREEA